MPRPIDSEDAAAATDFIAQCQAHIRKAEAAHKQEKEPFLTAGRAVDAFFKRRCDTLNAALAPAVSRLKSYRDQFAEAGGGGLKLARRAAEEEARRAATRQKRTAPKPNGWRARTRALPIAATPPRSCAAEDAAARAAAADERATVVLEPTRIRDYGATAYVSRGWTFEVIDLDKVPREYAGIDVAGVRRRSPKTGCRGNPWAEDLPSRGAAGQGAV